MLSISVQQREPVRPEQLRQNGRIPAVVYGGDRTGASSVQLERAAFEHLYDEAGESTLIDLHIAGEQEPVKVVIQDVQYDPIKRTVNHVDFKQIRMGEEMHATVELEFVGEALTVKELGGTLMQPVTTVHIKCLPQHLISSIEVDLSVLKTFDDAITVGDLPVPSTVTVTDDPDISVATVTRPLTEEELKAMEEEAAPGVEDVEVEEKGKKEESKEASSDADKQEQDKEA